MRWLSGKQAIGFGAPPFQADVGNTVFQSRL
jgi:hypothetical protein